MEAIRYVQRPQPDQNILFPGVSGIGVTPGLLNVTSGVGSTILGSTTSSAFPGSGGLLGIPAPATYDEVKREGEHVFEAKWTTTLTSKGKLTRPKLLAVDLKTTNWKET
jgi:hypothetical protein